MGEIAALWQEAEEHIRAFEQLARRTVEEAWLAGDALLRIKQQLPHGTWTPALAERGIPARTAQRCIRLRQAYPQKRQLVAFDSVSAALTGKGKGKRPRAKAKAGHPAFLVSVDDMFDWERGEVTAMARRLMNAEAQKEFSEAILNVIQEYLEEFETVQELANALTWFRLALSCQVDIGPLENNPAAQAETERRTDGFFGSQFDWLENPDDFLRICLHMSGRLHRLKGVSRARILMLNGPGGEKPYEQVEETRLVQASFSGSNGLGNT